MGYRVIGFDNFSTGSLSNLADLEQVLTRMLGSRLSPISSMMNRSGLR